MFFFFVLHLFQIPVPMLLSGFLNFTQSQFTVQRYNNLSDHNRISLKIRATRLLDLQMWKTITLIFFKPSSLCIVKKIIGKIAVLDMDRLSFLISTLSAVKSNGNFFLNWSPTVKKWSQTIKKSSPNSFYLFSMVLSLLF